MKRILFTAAEQEELACAQHTWRIFEPRLKDRVEPEFMLTGIGTTSVCYRLTKKIMEQRCLQKEYDLVINIGIAGSYNMKSFPMGSVTLIREEYFGDLGFETLFGFQTLFQYELLDANAFPFKDGALRRIPLDGALEKTLDKYREAVGVTVQTVSGNPDRVSSIRKRFAPDIESMEGAAVYYVCLLEKIPCFELRSVSNQVGERDKSKWNIPLALESLTDACKEILASFECPGQPSAQ